MDKDKDDDNSSVKSIKDKLKNLVELFDCTICCNLLTQPTQNTCGHIFCSDCITNITRLGKGDAKCPNCRRKLIRRSVRIRNDITELNLAVRYLDGTVTRELSTNKEKENNDNHQSSDNCTDFEEEEIDDIKNDVVVPLVVSSPPQLLTENNQHYQSSRSSNYCTAMEEVEDIPSQPSSQPLPLLTEYNHHNASSSQPQSQPLPTLTQNEPRRAIVGNCTEFEEEVNDVPQSASHQSQPLPLPPPTDNNHQSPAAGVVENCADFEQADGLHDADADNISSPQSQPLSSLTENNQPPAAVMVDNCVEKDDDGLNDVIVSSQPLHRLTQSQPLDLSMLSTTTGQLNDGGDCEQPESLLLGGSTTMKFVEPLDLSTKKKRPREMISEIYQQPENWSRRHPVFHLQEDGSRRESAKRQKLLQDDFVVYHHQHHQHHRRTENSNNNFQLAPTTTIREQQRTTIREEAASSTTPAPPIVVAANDESPAEGGEHSETHEHEIEEVVVENEKEFVPDSGSSDTENDEDQVIPCTPPPNNDKKEDRPVSPDSSCSSIINNNNNNTNNNNNYDLGVNSNSNTRSTFATPLPSQWNNINLSAPLVVEESPPDTNNDESQPKRKFIICPSRLNRVELAKLSDICSICDGTISKEYTDEVTHLVIKLEKGRVPHTMKYLFAIADKKWIVVYDWVLECSMQAEMVSEEPYESSIFPECDSGVRKSRINPSLLLENVPFYFPIVLKSSGATNDDCKKLVEKMGGIIVGSAFDVSPETGVIIIGESSIQSKHLYQELYKSRGFLSIAWTWVLDCLLTYSIVPFTKTHLLTKLDGTGSINLPAPLINANSCTPLSSHFNGRRSLSP